MEINVQGDSDNVPNISIQNIAVETNLEYEVPIEKAQEGPTEKHVESSTEFLHREGLACCKRSFFKPFLYSFEFWIA